MSIIDSKTHVQCLVYRCDVKYVLVVGEILENDLRSYFIEYKHVAFILYVVVERTWESDYLKNITFGQLYENIAPTNIKNQAVAILIDHKAPHKEPSQFINVRIGQALALLNLQGSNFARFQISTERTDSDETPREQNAFTMMMSSARIKVLPFTRNVNNNKDKLFNDIISVFQDHDVGFSKGTEDFNGKNFISYLRDLIWYLDTHWGTLKEAVAVKMPDFVWDVYKKNSECNDPSKIIYYNDYQSKKLVIPRCTQEELSKFMLNGIMSTYKRSG